MPTSFVVALAVVFAIGLAGLFAGLYAFFREYGEEQRNPVPAWDRQATQELHLWRQEQEKQRARCPHCKGTRCYDWRVNGRSCEDNPTTAEPNKDPLVLGRHHIFTLRPVPAGWWPIPRTLMGRANPHLWRKVADHCQIAVSYRRTVALP